MFNQSRPSNKYHQSGAEGHQSHVTFRHEALLLDHQGQELACSKSNESRVKPTQGDWEMTTLKNWWPPLTGP